MAAPVEGMCGETRRAHGPPEGRRRWMLRRSYRSRRRHHDFRGVGANTSSEQCQNRGRGGEVWWIASPPIRLQIHLVGPPGGGAEQGVRRLGAGPLGYAQFQQTVSNSACTQRARGGATHTRDPSGRRTPRDGTLRTLRTTGKSAGPKAAGIARIAAETGGNGVSRLRRHPRDCGRGTFLEPVKVA